MPRELRQQRPDPQLVVLGWPLLTPWPVWARAVDEAAWLALLLYSQVTRYRARHHGPVAPPTGPRDWRPRELPPLGPGSDPGRWRHAPKVF
jgi:hypothetical protein